MILIAESGGTKCDWVALDQTKIHFRTSGQGLHPGQLTWSQIEKELHHLFKGQQFPDHVVHIHFFGAGYALDSSRQSLKTRLEKYFPNASILIQSDLIAAAIACSAGSPGIICILGTGSNSGLFNGEKIINQIPTLGFPIGDEGSSTHLGALLLKAFAYKQLPKAEEHVFLEQFPLSIDLLKTKLFSAPLRPFLASFSPFLSKHQHLAGFEKLISKSFDEFIKHHLLGYEQASEITVHAVGTVAYHFKSIWGQRLKHHGLKPGKVIQRPLEDLILHYQQALGRA